MTQFHPQLHSPEEAVTYWDEPRYKQMIRDLLHVMVKKGFSVRVRTIKLLFVHVIGFYQTMKINELDLCKLTKMNVASISSQTTTQQVTKEIYNMQDNNSLMRFVVLVLKAKLYINFQEYEHVSSQFSNNARRKGVMVSWVGICRKLYFYCKDLVFI